MAEEEGFDAPSPSANSRGPRSARPETAHWAVSPSQGSNPRPLSDHLGQLRTV